MKSRVLLIASILFSSFLQAADPEITVSQDHSDGVYARNEKVTWTFDVKGDRSGLTALPYKVKKDAAGIVLSGTIDLSSGPAVISASREEPGALLTEIYAMDSSKLLPIAMGGAVIAPDEIQPAKSAPDDFDIFWKAKLKELDAVAANPILEAVAVDNIKNAEGVECFKVTLDNIRSTHVRGILAKPAKAGKYPAMLMVNSAGVFGLDKASVIAQAKPGWIVLNVSAHDLPVDEAEGFYKNLKETSLKNYYAIGNEDRETSYFLGMFLGCVRGAEYLASRADWDGKTLIVTGTSQGGLQSLAVAGLFPKISVAMVMVPAGCDNYAPLANPPRGVAWPYWMAKYAQQGKDFAKVQETAGYFDGINFASRIHCPALVAVALLDIAARPAGVIAAYNSMNTAKKLIIMPTSDHYGQNHGNGPRNLCPYFPEFFAWKEALQKEKALPIIIKK
ncbi:MAG: acetylxylan esterase [Chthoniobacterales bacterium]